MTEQTPSSKKPYRRHRERDSAADRPAFRIQNRDYEILRSVFEHRFLNLELVRLLFPPGRAQNDLTTHGRRAGSNLEKRLQKLFHHGYLDRLRPITGAAIVYAITYDGVKEIRSHYTDQQIPLPFHVPNRTKAVLDRNTKVSTAYINHSLMVSRFGIRLAFALEQLPTAKLLTWQTTDLVAKWTYRGRKMTVVPDAFFVLHDEQTRRNRSYFLEADQGTMDHNRMLAKYHDYSRMRQDGKQTRFCYQSSAGEDRHVEQFAVLTVTTTPDGRAPETRRDNLAQVVAKASADTINPTDKKRFLSAIEGDYIAHAENILAPIWRPHSPTDRFAGILSTTLPRR